MIYTVPKIKDLGEQPYQTILVDGGIDVETRIEELVGMSGRKILGNNLVELDQLRNGYNPPIVKGSDVTDIEGGELQVGEDIVDCIYVKIEGRRLPVVGLAVNDPINDEIVLGVLGKYT